MDYKQKYTMWLDNVDDDILKSELQKMVDDAELRDRFGWELEFGTAGLRGTLGAGTSRMNIYTVRRATQGLAEYICEKHGDGSVAISYDSRNMSLEFARTSAQVLAANGIRVYLYDRIMPVPLLSFAVRELKTAAGIMITASHNPAEYNGYKVYGDDGCQMTPEDVEHVYNKIGNINAFSDVKIIDFEEGLKSGLISYIDDSVVERYYYEVRKQQINPGICADYPVKVLYSPLHGSGNEPVRRILSDIGVTDVNVVSEQEKPDGNFPTCPYPNPETKEALAMGLEVSATLKPDLFIATDPDADRVGVAFRDGDDYRILNGNEAGALLLQYIVEARTGNGTMPDDPVAVRSIVSTAMADEIAKDSGVEMRAVLTGFKYIGEQILLLEQQGEEDRFIFGFEESCGYLAGSYVRDKDAVIACMLLCEMTAYYKKRGTTPVEALEELYKKYGYYVSGVVNIMFEGADGQQEMNGVMDNIFSNTPNTIAGFAVTAIKDYRAGIHKNIVSGERADIGLIPTNAIEFSLENGASVIVRPSGTEPKMKIYLTAKERTADDSARLIKTLEEETQKMIAM